MSRVSTTPKFSFMLRSETEDHEPPPAGSVTPELEDEFEKREVEPSLDIENLLLVSVMFAVVLLKIKPVVKAVFV